MSGKASNKGQFWKELKRRKVIRRNMVYAASGFVILELVSIIAEPFGLPDWTLKFVFILLCIGFVTSIILSWFYDFTPDGIERIKSTDLSSDAPHENASRLIAWKIATYISIPIIVGLVVFNIISGNKQGEDLSEVEKSIAVLPFLDLSPNKDQDYFCYGMTEEMNNALTHVEGLKVIGSSSVFALVDAYEDIRDIGNKLGVETLLKGSVQKDGNRLRITAQLVKVDDGAHLWSESYDRNLESIFDIQDEISLAIAENLIVNLLGKEKAAIEKRPTENLEAYNLYLRGIFEIRTYTKSGIQNAAEYFKRAIALDSNYAQAYSGLALSQIARASMFSAELSTFDAFVIAKPLIDKALSIDPDLAEALTWNGFYFLFNNWDFQEAEREYKKAIVNDDPDALAIYADFLNFTSRHEEALAICERLEQTNPYYPNTRMILTLYYVGKFETATKFADSRLVLFNNYYTLDSYGFLLLNTGNYDKAIQLFQNAIGIDGIRTPRMLGWMGAAYAKTGKREKSLELMDELKAKREQSDAGSTAFFIAVIYAALDDKASALQWLQVAYDNHEMEMPWLKTEPQFYALHDEPVFQELLNKVGFP